MGRSDKDELRNPSQRFFSWKGGEISWYDKETKTNTVVPLPFTFLVLEKLATIGGFSDEDQSGIWANEVRNLQTETLTVRTKAGIKKQGLYADVKTVTGAKYCASIYIAYADEQKKLVIGNLKLTGAALSAWIEFSKGKDIYQGAVVISGKEEAKKGATKYYSPVFEMIPKVKQETEDAAIKLHLQLKEYLTEYFKLRGNQPEATNDDYIAQRNAELEDFEGESAKGAAASGGDSWKGALGENDFSVDEDTEIPF